ncbi:MAG: alpha-1,4-glucan--maltose-1-phosphate maltosyltransferase [Sulfuricella sp.]|nr:alpha-1,4-glucan--maltose-1-phosphate maltosyltransferase [Sulfuricella sp.]
MTGTIVIENIYPELDCGRYPVKREVGDRLEVEADIFKEGHDLLAAVVKYREADAADWLEAPMAQVVNDRWRGGFALEKNTRYRYAIEAWVDQFESWRAELEKKLEAGQAVGLELLEGRQLVAAAAERAADDDRSQLRRVVENFDRQTLDAERTDLLLAPALRRLMVRHPDRSTAAACERELEVVADRPAARFAAWYEMFPRSQGRVRGKSATFRDCAARLPEIRSMGFDVVYLVPIHPIGATHRKGPNNTEELVPGAPGSPYAIGSEAGGHKAVHPELGTLEDFRAFVRQAGEHGLEVALDFAIQCSPDHPYLKEHPDWFRYRPDGSIKYAENPPKKYQDIFNVDFYSPAKDEIWREWLDVVLFWIGQGVKIFRVDNPHTKPIAFWEWLIREVQNERPDIIFLAEAFTRPKLLKALAKAGFTQSYTYFTWRNFKQELADYLTELTQSEVKEYLRPNFFTCTPDILPAFLQSGGRPAFIIRLVLAATLSSVYGIYNGFELCEAAAVPGTEEYLDSEKYDYKVWDWDRPGHIKEEIAAINRIRLENPALHELENLRFYPADDDNVLFYGKATLDGSNTVFVAVNLDPFEAHQAVLEFPLQELGIPRDKTFQVEELLTGRKHLWRGHRHIVDLDPRQNPAEIYRITRWAYRDYVETCF